MKLLELTEEEHAWLAAPLQGGVGLAAHLERALADTLCARLRCTVGLEPLAAHTAVLAPAAPVWRIDDALAALWLARRLGGRFTGGRVPFLSAGLQATLDTMLAERWFDQPDAAPMPATFAWRIIADGAVATLGLELPRDARMMASWAQRIVTGATA
jgi:hypothetical protein